MNGLKRKKYVQEQYSKYWITARDKIYGFLDYDRALCKLMSSFLPNGARILEVAVGTGFPFGSYFSDEQYQIHGIDLSIKMIESCHRTFPDINCVVGDAENLQYRNDVFEATYCFHSTFFFPNITNALEEMFRVTKNSGIICFDIQNMNNRIIAEGYNKLMKEQATKDRNRRKIINLVKNYAKLILKRPVNWDNVIYETPTEPETILSFFKEKVPTEVNVFAPNPYPSADLIEVNNEIIYENFQRLIFFVKK